MFKKYVRRCASFQLTTCIAPVPTSSTPINFTFAHGLHSLCYTAFADSAEWVYYAKFTRPSPSCWGSGTQTSVEGGFLATRKHAPAGDPLCEFFSLSLVCGFKGGSIFAGPEDKRILAHNVIPLHERHYFLVKCVAWCMVVQVPTFSLNLFIHNSWWLVASPNYKGVFLLYYSWYYCNLKWMALNDITTIGHRMQKWWWN